MGHILAAFGYSIFEGSQAFIVDPVGGPHASFSFVAQKADVDPTLGPRRHRLPQSASPRDVLVCQHFFFMKKNVVVSSGSFIVDNGVCGW